MDAAAAKSIGVLICLWALPAGAVDLVGKTAPPYPDGMTSSMGTCVTDTAGLEHVCDYGIAIVDDAKGIHRLVIAQQSLGLHGAAWRVLDTLTYPPLRKDEQLSIGTCRAHGSEDTSILAVVGSGSGDEDAEFLGRVREAWRLDFAKKRFVPIPVAGIDCLNESYGL